MEFKKQKPIYLQIADSLCERIVAGEWAAEERILSVRDVAAELGVNPNTVLRSFDHLQSSEIIFNRRGVGYFLAADASDRVVAMRRQYFLQEEFPFILQQMKLVGLTLKDLEQYETHLQS